MPGQVGNIIVPNKALLNCLNATGLLRANAANFKLALLKDTYVPNNGDNGDEYWSDISAHEIAAGNGYIAGGSDMTGIVLSLSGGKVKFTSNPVSWVATGSGFPGWRRGVIYYNGVLNGKINPILAHFLGDTTPADVPATTVSNSPLTISPSSLGLFEVSVSS